VDDKQILDIVHQMAAEMMGAKDSDAMSADNLIDRYDFSSIDTLKYLLTLEEKFGVALADEDFTEELLFSATTLAERIATLRRAGDKDLGPAIDARTRIRTAMTPAVTPARTVVNWT